MYSRIWISTYFRQALHGRLTAIFFSRVDLVDRTQALLVSEEFLFWAGCGFVTIRIGKPLSITSFRDWERAVQRLWVLAAVLRQTLQARPLILVLE